MKSVIQKFKCITVIMFTGGIFVISFYKPVAAQDSFRDPLEIPMKLSANFGEVRADHFHTGFDIRTNEKTGLKVFAAASGYVSRIKVSAYGYGRALYITHPGGYISVYGHLSRFNDTIEKFVRLQQYAKESFEVELFPEAGKFPVKQGDLIAWSGNSGVSGGPHLHFEIRDASGETYPLNPASFFKLNDTIAPTFNALYIYPISQRAGTFSKYLLSHDSSNFTSIPDSITVDATTIGVGAEAEDFMNQSSNYFGVYEFSVSLDDQRIYNVKFDRLDFNQGRYVNAYIDYAEKKKSGEIIQRFFHLPGDHNSIYRDLKNDGKILLRDTGYHKVTIEATDAYQNSSRLNFFIRFSGIERNFEDTVTSKIFAYDKPNSFINDSIRLNFPANVLYENLNFHYSTIPADKSNIYSAIHSVNNAFVPVHSYYDISILPHFIPPALKAKAVIVYENENGNRSRKTSHWDGNWISARAREFGNFYVMLDTTKPKIASAGIKQNHKLTSNTLKFSITDNLSGIVSYKGFLDGKWVLMEYDPKTDALTCELDPKLHTGEHSVKVIVTDDVKNESIYTLKFIK